MTKLPDFDMQREYEAMRRQEKAELQGALAKECHGCGRYWGADELDEDGFCPGCAEMNAEDDGKKLPGKDFEKWIEEMENKTTDDEAADEEFYGLGYDGDTK